MYAYTVWSPDTGAGATTLATALARAHAEAGNRVLAIDFAPPDDGLTAHFGLEAVGGPTGIVAHLIETASEALESTIQPAEPGVDVLPTDPSLASLDDTLDGNATLAEFSAPRSDYRHPTTRQLHRVLHESRVFYEYDLLVLDAAPGFSQSVYNAAYAAPNLLVPVGDRAAAAAIPPAIDRLRDRIDGANLMLLGTVENERSAAGADRDAHVETDDQGSSVIAPITIPHAPDLFGDARRHGVSPFEVSSAEDDRNLAPGEQAVLDAIDALAALLLEHLANPTDGSE